MIESLITSKTRRKILTLLITENMDFHLRKIQRLTKENVTSVRRELENLTKSGIVTQSTKGNLKLFAINKDSPIYEDVKNIIMKTSGIGKLIADKLKNFNIKHALVYGSFAKGKQIQTSDIDVLIIGNVNEDKLLGTIKELENLTKREINYILWSEKEFLKKAKQKHSLLYNIIKNPIIGLMGDMNEFRRIVKGKIGRKDTTR